MKVTKLIPQGICKGVARAITIVNKELTNKNIIKPIYMIGNLVHNKNIMQGFIDKGIILINENDKKNALLKINKGTVIFTAHGVSKELINIAREKKLNIIDTTCTDVTKIHSLISSYIKENYSVIFLGVKNHPESNAIVNDFPVYFITEDSILEDLPKLTGNIILTNQSTMSYIKVKEIYYDLLKYYPNLILSEEVCPATRLRQEALINSNENADLIIVVGDKMSNNTKMLKAIGKTHNKKKTILLETVEDLNKYDLSEFQNCIITSGASTPFAVVQEIINALKTYDKNTKYISKLNTKDYLKLKG
ncbi:MAG: 4-hydroxy-3-methylbut-2-enyl diphosphate reductase [Bacilli bacterium]|jgi:4-hydroxy-3-methylbut-2-enyl diphosphate reductase|nr:4-hydroxy-3-methylbut-2-enyl diphosphate reductase [Bacilli bacterium]MDD2681369.1 4-hydroxy-3-methylbut-2-enyl diphosphate reductase [Bacilli bacterium]MDD3120878.1 4-hydroxy-3-methylbut-2-enyl diphosphate reductase [Bacilli bacterium]MDD4063073.1 4-hydroxy-3-methylbut-2-enyl diphosphate reductase [Bacilli bacterium]MDD4481647.1 4-hydroxy-3-methylbut-2-enyl diphosphate reductase [Bacilli bacterium]